MSTGKAALDAAISKAVSQISQTILPVFPAGQFQNGGVIPVREQKTKYLFESGETIPLGKVESIAIVPPPGEHIIPTAVAEEMRRKMQDRLGLAMTGSFTATVTSNNVEPTGEPMRAEQMLAEIERLRAKIKPVPMFVSSAMLPADAALTFKFEDREYCGAHPDLWKQVPESCGIEVVETVTSFADVEIIDLDADTPDARKARGTFYHAMAGVMLGEKK